jgi:type IV secretion system protein VirB5
MTTQWQPDGPLDTPYRRARSGTPAWAAPSSRGNWRWRPSVDGAVLVMAGGMIYPARCPAVPIIEVDRLGAAVYHGPVGQSDYVPPDAVVSYHLRRFIADTREISSDGAVLKQNWLDAYTLLTPRGGNMLSAFLQKPENDPFRRVVDERVTVEILSCVRAAGDTWQVDWRESSWDKNGALIAAPVTWRAMLRTLLAAPKTAEAMKKNPIGLYIDELHWDKVGG